MSPSDFDSVHGISPGKHFYQFYKNFDDYMKVIIPYFSAGLNKGEACIWVISSRIGLENAIASARALIPGFNAKVASKQLTLKSSDDWYFEQGQFSEARALKNAADFIQWSQAEGYAVIRGNGDLSTVNSKEFALVHDYDKKMCELIGGSNIIALCSFCIDVCNLSDTRRILENHDDALVGSLR